MQGGHAIEAAFCKLKSGRQIQLLTLARLGHDQAGLMQGPGFADGGQPGGGQPLIIRGIHQENISRRALPGR